MNLIQDKNTASTPVRNARAGRRWLIAAAVAAAIGATGAAGAGIAGEGLGMHGHGHHGRMDAASMEKHIEKMIARVAPDATPQQKARLTAIARSAFADLQPIQAQSREAHKRIHDLLAQPKIDRAALEQLRVEQIQRADAASKRVLAAAVDAAEVLTPEQRVRFHEHMQKRMH